ncbi:unnamed protein product [Spirodela intermedia]|uniref:Uncharacterized protein n=1 Tax=Spirodela intermedia TaxID=51605 RepID=A0A7I8KBV6_SPIIN|nr:unnamed protein product [Spirodela intermedia]
MSIALGRSGEGTEFGRGIAGMAAWGSAEIAAGRRLPAVAAPPRGKGKGEDGGDSACCSSSIGSNSDCSRSDDSGEPEVQSSLKGPLETMDALEDSLPIRRGISRFYNGRSKSLTNLVEISFSSSARDLAKPENAYTRKRKNLLGSCSSRGERRRPSDTPAIAGGNIPKRPTNSRRATISPAGGTSSSDSNSVEEETEPSARLRPPRHPNAKNSSLTPCEGSPPRRCHFSVRSFSLSDIAGCNR